MHPLFRFVVNRVIAIRPFSFNRNWFSYKYVIDRNCCGVFWFIVISVGIEK